jgi:hypothetical protein
LRRRARIDSTTKEDASVALAAMGLSISDVPSTEKRSRLRTCRTGVAE